MSYKNAVTLADTLSKQGTHEAEGTNSEWRQAAEILAQRLKSVREDLTYTKNRLATVEEELTRAKQRIEQFEKYEIRQRREDCAE